MTTALPRESTPAATRGIGALLRGWREQRRISQLDLALRADSSARHISFVETGRSRPSEALILKLAHHLEVPLRERNALLLAAGYAPRFTETPVADPAFDAVRTSLEALIKGYEPYPALVLDATYGIVAANAGAGLLLEGVDPELLAQPLNAMRLTLHPRGLAPRIRNLGQWRGHLLEQMEREIALDRSPALRALYEEVAAYPVADPGTDSEGQVTRFALPMLIEHRGRVLSFLSAISTFNTPMDVTVAELAIETFVPADEATLTYLRAAD
ncbi:helix-turn-helix transcriptional regulator [Streptomyces sp. NA04227]|uniref:helix-turn-helix domain-containing protein n=1 Tax=Streptomyces sp. NA04227 TaxID=2742136 RepID=UPI0015928269|nr:helix-turn-helix transcriptional regulator [Streptomyces sp. NA04227]QKW10170.1 helix-turn-helix transcriptional regulator [Streptomyces sp. NA04227]